jgi:hypothetical protein
MTATTSQQLRVRFNKPQAKAWKAFQNGNVVVLPWGRGVGKSEFLLLCMFLLVAEWDSKARPEMGGTGVRIVVLMPATTQARKTLLRRFRSKLDGAWKFLGGNLHEVDLVATFPGGSYIQFVSQEQRELIRGIRCDVVFVDETDDITKNTYADVVSPWLSEPFSLRRRMLGGTPTQGRNGLLYELHTMARDGFPRHFGKRATWRDAPEHVSAEFVAGERAKAERNGALPAFHREWECDFDSAEGIVYPTFDRSLHVRDRDPRVVWTEMLVGVDHGVVHPGVFLLIGVAGKGEDAVCHVLDEVYETGQDDVWWAAKAREWASDKFYPGAFWFADPSQPARISSLKRVGARITEANNHVKDGLSEVSKRLAPWETDDKIRKARLYIAPRCVNTITEIEKYRRKRDRAGNILEEPEKKNDDAMDALRYALHTYFNGERGGRNRVGDDDR